MSEKNIIKTEEIEAAVNDTNLGNVKISDDVIASIATVVLNDINAVHSMNGSLASGIVEFLGVKKNNTKGIKVAIDESEAVSLEIHVTIQYGVRIPEVAWEIQEKVKKEVESVTGLTVAKVNVHVDGINIGKAKDIIEEAEEE